jgi:hypothetical protein
MKEITQDRLKNLLCLGVHWLTEVKGQPAWILIGDLLKIFVEIGELTEEQVLAVVTGIEGKQHRFWIKGKSSFVRAREEAVSVQSRTLFKMYVPKGKLVSYHTGVRKESDPKYLILEKELSLTRSGFEYAMKYEELSEEYRRLKESFLEKVSHLRLESEIRNMAARP